VPASMGHGLNREQRLLCLGGGCVGLLIPLLSRFVVPLAGRVPLLGLFLTHPCGLKALTGIPCPLCGGTRSVILAARGEWLRSLLMNPVGTLLVTAGPVAGMWLMACAVTGRDLGLSRAKRLLGGIRWGWALLLAVLWAWNLFHWLAAG